ncbi:MAG: DNA (cytosine-5-)-methyltransferase, partial [Candidatus Gastranaerophilales bacterium]|nr:DNA (cytosine-5-)-methyltransferase [Candidatus Gastranaerophilales bacterium]
MSLTFIDFCSGIGAGRLGLESLGFRCLAHSEINQDSDNTYKIFYNDENNLGDLTTIGYNSIPNTEILIAGFPCQTFSIVGKRAGFEDERGQIIYHLAKILKAKNIPYFIFENVKGLINHNKGTTINSIIELLNSAGYEVSYRVLNSIDYGVPQLRERVYFVGIRKDLYNKPFIFPETQQHVNVKDFLLPNNTNKQDIEHPTFQKYLNNKYNKGRIQLNKILENDYTIIDTRQSDLRIYENKCPTLRTGRHGILYVKNGELYKISGLEALLLQGFPKEYILKAKNLNNNKLLSQAGNAMT